MKTQPCSPVTDKSGITCRGEGIGTTMHFHLRAVIRGQRRSRYESAWILRFPECQELVCRMWIGDSVTVRCITGCAFPSCWSYGWFGWFTEKTRRGWVGVYLWPQRLINNRLRTPPVTLVQADDSQVRRLQLPWTEEGIRHGEGIHRVRSALLSHACIFQE